MMSAIGSYAASVAFDHAFYSVCIAHAARRFCFLADWCVVVEPLVQLSVYFATCSYKYHGGAKRAYTKCSTATSLR